MQQISTQNTRSAARPMIWLTIAFHLALGAFLYLKTSGGDTVQQHEKIEQVEKP